MNIKENQILGKKWIILIIKTLLGCDKSFSSIKREIFGISDKVLSQRLREMEKEKLLKRHVYTNTPIRVEYGLTEKGRNLKKAMYELTVWSNRYI